MQKVWLDYYPGLDENEMSDLIIETFDSRADRGNLEAFMRNFGCSIKRLTSVLIRPGSVVRVHNGPPSR